ncbi:hypothetical protein [Archaeoglobus sp.]
MKGVEWLENYIRENNINARIIEVKKLQLLKRLLKSLVAVKGR